MDISPKRFVAPSNVLPGDHTNSLKTPPSQAPMTPAITATDTAFVMFFSQSTSTSPAAACLCPTGAARSMPYSIPCCTIRGCRRRAEKSASSSPGSGPHLPRGPTPGPIYTHIVSQFRPPPGTREAPNGTIPPPPWSSFTPPAGEARKGRLPVCRDRCRRVRHCGGPPAPGLTALTCHRAGACGSRRRAR